MAREIHSISRKTKRRASQSGTSRGLRLMPKAMFKLASLSRHKWKKCMGDDCNRWVPLSWRGDKRFCGSRCKRRNSMQIKKARQEVK